MSVPPSWVTSVLTSELCSTGFQSHLLASPECWAQGSPMATHPFRILPWLLGSCLSPSCNLSPSMSCISAKLHSSFLWLSAIFLQLHKVLKLCSLPGNGSPTNSAVSWTIILCHPPAPFQVHTLLRALGFGSNPLRHFNMSM